MFYGLLLSLYLINCLFLVLIILIQKTKSSMGLGGLGGGTQMLFGGSGGQDIFQKSTWFLGATFMALSLLLALAKSQESRTIYYNGANQPVASAPLQPLQSLPSEE